MKKVAAEHWEKFLLGGVGLITLSFLWSALTVKSYDRDPEDFENMTRQAQAKVRGSAVDVEKLKTPDMREINGRLAAIIDPNRFGLTQRWAVKQNLGQGFRDEPQILRPDKPSTQSNRGLIASFEVDENGARVTRKVPKSKRIYAGRRVKNDRRDRKGKRVISGNPMTEMIAVAQEQGGAGPAKSMGTDNPMVIMLFEDSDRIREFGFEGPGLTPEELGEQRNPRVGERKRRFILLKDIPEAKEDDGKDGKKKPKEEEELVEEPVEIMVGKHWVEVVAAFPHAAQIKEYVRQLREPVDVVGLRYQMAEVERRELGPDQTWSDWTDASLFENINVVRNAVAFEPEPFPAVIMKGLAMNIPFLQTTYKPFLTSDEFERPVQARYTAEERNPQASMRTKPKNRARMRPVLPGQAAPKKKSDAKKADVVDRFLRKQPGVVDLDIDREKIRTGLQEKNRFNNRSQVKEAMIRFWDFGVEPGKRYQYRLRVRAFNPNYHRSDVSRGEYAEKDYLVGEWSEPSDEVYVEPDVRWYSSPRQHTSKPNQVTVQIHSWLRKMGEWVTTDITQRVGDLIGRSGGRGIKPTFVAFWDKNQGTWGMDDEVLRDEFDTGSVLLSVDGGSRREQFGAGRIATTIQVPRQIVAVDAYGDLVRRDAPTDRDDVVRESIVVAYDELINELKERGADKIKRSTDDARPTDPARRDPAPR